ncbi:MAG: GatB/YqeY domain-containing protein [Burkholderiales bacterium]
MSLKERITEDMKAAMRAKETQRLLTIRLLLAALKQKEVDERVVLTDADVLSIVEKLIKQRRDSISQYEAAKRQDLADVEAAELVLLQAYMPQQLSSDEINAEIAKALAETGASSAKDMGKAMGILKSRLAGRADMSKVSSLLKEKLAG